MGKIPIRNLKTVEIRVHWTASIGEGSSGFRTMQEFADFLTDNPEIAEAVGYVPKKGGEHESKKNDQR